ncbi:PilZ domain-containing protein [Sphingomonas endolithica]|uniref:PilZ domain-containing protein n=1 Tax=Sphingomonas endolithica TaxID=2972485 RepID=UPI003AAB8432
MGVQPQTNDPRGSSALDERRAERFPARVVAEIRGERLPPGEVKLVDVSVLGCRVEADHNVTVGSFVTLIFQGFAGFDGWIAWRRESSYGIDFAHPLPSAVVHRIVETCRVPAHAAG